MKNQFLSFLALGMLSTSIAFSDCSFDDTCCSDNCGGITLQADLLIFQPYEKGLGDCQFDTATYSLNTDGSVASSLEGRRLNPHFKWNPGFRLGLGYTFASCPVKADILWTHFHTHSHRSREDRSIGWGLDFDTLDAVARYSWGASDCLTITSFGGIRGASIYQRIHFEAPEPLLAAALNNKEKERFYGAGPLIGLDTRLNLGCGFNLYANASLFWLFGNYDIESKESDISENGTSFAKIKNHEHATQYGTDAACGIEWSTAFLETQVFFRLGLEHHRYFDYNYLGDGDLSLSGGVLSCYFAF